MNAFNTAKLGLRLCQLSQRHGRFAMAVGRNWEFGNQMKSLSSSAVMFRGRERPGEVHPGYIKIRERMKQFQVEDGVPIHLKGGAFDHVLYYTTWLLIFCGIVEFCRFIYGEAWPKKPSDSAEDEDNKC